MTKHTNAELREMMEGATPGEWWAGSDEDGPLPEGRVYFASTDSYCIPSCRADARLIAAMHAELPRLLEGSEELERVKCASFEGLERFDQEYIGTGHMSSLGLVRCQGGDWVRFDDVTAALASLRSQLAAKTEECERWRSDATAHPYLTSQLLEERTFLKSQLSAKAEDDQEFMVMVNHERDALREQLTASTERANRILEDAVVLVNWIERAQGVENLILSAREAADRILSLAKERA